MGCGCAGSQQPGQQPSGSGEQKGSGSNAATQQPGFTWNGPKGKATK